MGNYASALSSLGRNGEALVLNKRVLVERRRVLGESHPDTLGALNNYAISLSSAGRVAESASLLEVASELSQTTLGARHFLTLKFLENHTTALLKLGRHAEALPVARTLAQSSRERTKTLGQAGIRGTSQRDRERQGRLSIERDLANALWSNHQLDEELQPSLRAETFEALQLATANNVSKAVGEAAASRFAESVGLAELVKERRALDRAWLETEEAFVSAQTGGEATQADRVTLRDRLDLIETRMAEIDALLSEEAPQFFTILSQQAVELAELREVLDEDEAILFLVPTERGTHAMAVTREDMSWVRSDRNEDAITTHVNDFRFGLEIQAGAAFLPLFDFDLAHELYTDLIEPVEDALESKRRVYVVADGALSRLPLGTLIASPVADDANGEDSEVLRSADWLADRYALVQLPSLQSLVYIRAFGIEGYAADNAGFTGFGAPVLEGEARLRGARSATLGAVDAARLVSELRGSSGLPLMSPEALRKLAALPGTKGELEQVRDALGAQQEALYLAERMTEPSIRSADLSKTRILHLATHGFTSDESGETAEPGLVFTPPAQARPEDDGYLAASEVVGLNLTLAQCVILSACNTASPSGRPGETGLSGLAQAFFYAGAQSLLVSHWPVFDDIAQLLTVGALKRSEAGEPRAEALQAAMREIRNNPKRDAAHPAVWAPFTLVGEGR